MSIGRLIAGCGAAFVRSLEKACYREAIAASLPELPDAPDSVRNASAHPRRATLREVHEGREAGRPHALRRGHRVVRRARAREKNLTLKSGGKVPTRAPGELPCGGPIHLLPRKSNPRPSYPGRGLRQLTAGWSRGR